MICRMTKIPPHEGHEGELTNDRKIGVVLKD